VFDLVDAVGSEPDLRVVHESDCNDCLFVVGEAVKRIRIQE
jgi:hypothetical protein